MTLQPLDKARGAITSNQLNLFLYQVLRSAAWTNQNIPRQSQPGESPAPLLPLNLWYLVTAFGRDDDATEPFGHQLLGRAMSVLNDYPILSPDDIRSATSVALPRADLDQQIERVRITLQPLSVEDISKLWTGFATQYRLSAAYEISLVLIDSTLPSKTPLLVLTRGKGDQGILAQTDFSSPFPSLTSATPPGAQPSVKLGDTLTLAGQPLTTSLLRADERIVNYLKGLNYPDDHLAPLVTPLVVPAAGATKPPSQLDAEDALLARVKQSSADTPLVVQLAGRDTATKELIAGSVADSLGLRIFRISAGLLPTQAAEIEWFVRLWNRESLLLRSALYVDARNVDAESVVGQATSLALSRMRGLMFLDTQDAWAHAGGSTVIVETAKPTPRGQQILWAAELGALAADNPTLLPAQFDLGAMEIHQIAQEHIAEESTAAMADRLWSRCLDAPRPRLDGLAQSLQPKATWSDIVLPPAEMSLLQQIAAQVGQRGKVYEDWGFASKMSRGLGISALFAGESGTGKTMAAEVLANSLKLNLNRADLSSVVSKYIGETEKNLRRLFDAAEDGGVILFFDEADALFGKHSEVKDSHDRYANIEVNYLLQRMESYRGLAILATNKKTALDQAFLRRLRFIVKFPFPGVEERSAIWKSVFLKDTPVAGLDFARLAKFNVTGGNIHNIAVNAAFRRTCRDAGEHADGTGRGARGIPKDRAAGQ